MLKKLISVLIVAFFLGWLSHTFYAGLEAARAEPIAEAAQEPHPLPEAGNALPAKEPVPAASTEKLLPAQIPALPEEGRGKPLPSPSDRLSPSEVHVTSNRVVIDGIPGHTYETALFAKTHSMERFLDENAQAIQTIPLSPDELKVGDIISYDPGMSIGVIIHRIIAIGTDSQGWYAIVKGDNNPSPDPVKVRFAMIKRVLVGILY